MKAKKIKDLLIGSNNPGKVREIKQLLPKNIKVSSIIDYKLKSPVENGKTFLQNSYIKSKYFSKKTGKICLADDSGLEIDILHKKPGIYSARFICALSIYGPKTRKIHAVAKIEGRISNKKIGKNGFGYDPIFIPSGKKVTFGQMKFFKKFKMDHRAKAFKKLKKFL